jgi:hypothetical protein
MVAIDDETLYRREVSEKAEPTHVRKSSPSKPREEPILRTWHDSAGTHAIEAKFHGMIGGKVRLKKADGSTITVPLEKLSDDDQAWIKARVKR